MKKTFLALALAFLCGAPLSAQEAAPAASSSAVADALAIPGITYLTETLPAADAKFYVYLCSASWCGPCRAIMPKIVEQYSDIKAAGGEIVLLCCDRTPAAGKAYLKKYDADIPSILLDVRTASSLRLPGFMPPRSIPYAVIVSADGTVLQKGHGGIVLNWREITKQGN